MQSAPDGFELEHPSQAGIAGVVGAVDGADAGADHHIGENSVGGERVHHAYLNGAEAASAREYKSRSGGASMIGSRQTSNAPDIAASRKPHDVGGAYSRQQQHRIIKIGCWRAGFESCHRSFVTGDISTEMSDRRQQVEALLAIACYRGRQVIPNAVGPDFAE